MSVSARLLTSILAIAALTLPGIAAAKTNCPVLQSIVSGDPAQLEGVAVTVNSDGLLDVTKHGVAGILRDAEACSLTAPKDDFDLDCDWSFAAGEEKKSSRQFDRLRKQLDACLPAPLEQQVPVRYTAEKIEEFRQKYGDSMAKTVKNNETLQRFTLTIETASGADVDLTLRMSRRKDSGLTRINFNIYQ